MNKDKLKLWINALRSGEYEQGFGSLARSDAWGDMRYCCLGVACEVAIKDGLDLQVDLPVDLPRDMGDVVVKTYGVWQDPGFMPDEVSEWLGHDDRNVLVDLPNLGEHKTEHVAFLNDVEHRSFEWIADALEATYLKEDK